MLDEAVKAIFVYSYRLWATTNHSAHNIQLIVSLLSEKIGAAQCADQSKPTKLFNV